MQIWKYELTPSITTLEVPRRARFLDVQPQGGAPMWWAVVDPEAPDVKRGIRIVRTGHEFDGHGDHVATFQLGAYVFHVFDLGEVSNEPLPEGEDYENPGKASD